MQIFFSGENRSVGAVLIQRLLHQGHEVSVLCEPGVEMYVPVGTSLVLGDALDSSSFAPIMPITDTCIHLADDDHSGTHSASLAASIAAAVRRSISHFVYVNLRKFDAAEEVSQAGEELIGQSGLNATIVRPWHATGSAVTTMPVSREQLRDAIVWAVENPALGKRYLNAREIRELATFLSEADESDLIPAADSETTLRIPASHEHGKSERRTKAECSAGHH